jgi:alkylhydroperoxidase family enzyme
MTSAVQVPEPVFQAIRGHFSPRQLVELTLLIGAYNMQNRVFEALDVDLEPVAPGGS